MTTAAPEVTGRSRLLLALGAVAVAFAAADTYVVVLALPQMGTSVGIGLDQLQRAAPIISGFLLGYVAMLPMIGRIADLRGRVPVLLMGLVVFAIGSLLTALSYDLTTMVAGRFLQGLGGGALVPATLGLVADLYPAERRGLPLGVVSAVQEIGSVLGPLLGALVLAVADWRAIFLLNLAVGLVLAAAVLAVREPVATTPGDEPHPRTRSRPDLVGGALLVVALTALVLVLRPPAALMRDLTWGALFVPYVEGGGRWLTPVGLACAVASVALLARLLLARRPLVDLRSWLRAMWEADLVGSLLLAAALSGVILAFATADPKQELISRYGVWFLLAGGAAAALLVLHLRTARSPVVPRGALHRAPAWGSLLVSFLIGAALIAALVDIPLFARTTVHPDSQLGAALVLVRFLVALPVGAVVGGYLTRWWSCGVVTALGTGLAAGAFVAMSRWGLESLNHPSSWVTLLVGGFGFGLALAPVNAAALAASDHAVHGLVSALVVVARMVGMLVGISALTSIGLRAYFATQAGFPPPDEVCDGKTRCAAYTRLLKEAGMAQEHTIFLGAAGCALAAAVLALVVFRTVPRTGTPRR